MINTSQNINLSYGYLWWLNGKASYHIPNYQVQIPGALSPHAPADMFSALGKNDQILDVVPSMNLVMIRMGDPFGLTLEIGTVVNDSIWVKLNDVFCNGTPVVDIFADKQMEVYPNPSTKTFTVSLPSGTFDLLISDTAGRKVYEQKNVIGKAEINCNGFYGGMYFLLATDGKDNYSRKIIVSK